MYTRTLEQINPILFSCFLLGPRQVGKTTFLSKLPRLFYINLLNTQDFLSYNVNPSRLYSEISALPKKKGNVIIDEIQKVPLLLNEVQRCIDEFPDLNFILSGSSARKLRRGSANLLGGRAVMFSLYPLSIEELGKDFDLEQVLRFGSLPKVCELCSHNKELQAKRLLRSYVTSYLAEEIKAESLVRNLENFQRFLNVAAAQYAREINFSALGDEALLPVNSVKNYYSILEDTLIGFFLQPYTTSIRKQLTKTPKFYLFDNGVTRAIQGLLDAPATNQESGYLFEQLLIQEVQKINAYYEKDFQLYFWKTTAGSEVDLLITRANKLLLAVEFKATPFPNTRDISGLVSLHEEYPKVEKLLCAPLQRALILKNQFRAVGPKEFLEMVKKL